MYFHTDSPRTINWLADVLVSASEQERSVRFAVGGDGSLKVKVGEGAWTAPIASTPDKYRDQSQKTQSCRKCNYEAEGKWDGAASVSHTCGIKEEPDTDEGLVCAECQGQNGSHFLNCSVWSFN